MRSSSRLFQSAAHHMPTGNLASLPSLPKQLAFLITAQTFFTLGMEQMEQFAPENKSSAYSPVISKSSISK